MNQLKNGKAPEECGIFAEILAALLRLQTLLCTIWDMVLIPTDRSGGCRSDLEG